MKHPPMAHTFRQLAKAHSFWLIVFLSLFLPSALISAVLDDSAAQYLKIQSEFEHADYDRALEEARAAWLRQPNSEWGLKFKAQLVLLLLYRSNTEDAEQLLREPPPPQFLSLRPRYQYLTALLAIRQKDSRARALLTAAFRTAKAQGDAEAEIDDLLLMARLDERHQAQYLQDALRLSQSKKLVYREASALNELGLLMKGRERYADAIDYFSKEASVAAKDAKFLQLIALENRAGCYLNLGDLDRALQSLQEARSQLRPEMPIALRADVTMQLAEVYSSLQRNSEAIGYYRDAFKIIRNDPKLDDYAPAAERLAAALIQTGQVSEAETYNSLALECLRQYPRSDPFDSALCELNRADIAAQRKQIPAAIACYRKSLALAKSPNAVRWSAYAGLAALDHQQGHLVEARQDFEQALAAIEANRSQQKSAENQITFLTALIHFYQQYVDFLVEQKQPHEALKVADSSRASVLSGLQVARQDPAFYAKIRAEAHAANTAILFYWLGPEKSYVWAITPTGDEFLLLPKSSEIEKLVQTYSHSIQSAQQDTLARQSSAGFSLYKILIGPIASHLKPDVQVVMVPDGVLHSLNFETLLVSDDKKAPHYWIEDVRLTVAPSLRMLLEKNKPLNPSKQALVMGGAIYSGAEYSQLSGSQAEVEKISALFPKSSTVTLTGRNAVPEAFEKAHPELFSIIHISAHAIDNPRSPLDSAIILSGQEGSRELYAIDLMRQANRFNADLVTISGCNSVGTALKGEGMVGFAWAAFAAGARNAVTSLWEVDDRSTTELMDHFYRGVTQGKPYAQALRDAKLQMLKGSFKKPYYWAPFQLYSRSLTSAPNHVLQAKR